MSEPLRIQQIRQFLIAAQNGNFRAAASGTFRSQAAVSAAMRELERQIGAELFEKGRRAKLTPLAECLRPLFQELLTVYDNVVTEVRQLAKAERGAVSVAVVPVLAEEWLPAFVSSFIAEFPHVRVRATDLRSPQVRALVADGSVDIGIASKMKDDPKLDFLPIAADGFGVLCHPGHPFAKARKGVPWSALRNERLIGNDSFEVLKGEGLGDWVEDPAVVVTSRVSLMACVKAGLGVTVVPSLTKAEESLGIVFVPLKSPRIMRTIGIVTRRRQTMLPTLAAMHARLAVSLRNYARSRGAQMIDEAPAAARR
jgi:DNA-binding transcriptional LysR family regulator